MTAGLAVKIKLGDQYFTSKHFDMSYDKLRGHVSFIKRN